MKKCAIITFYSALFLLFSCGGEKRSDDTVAPAITAEENTFYFQDTIKVHEHCSYPFAGEDSPTLTVDITLPTVHLNGTAVSARIDSTLAFGLFEEHTSLQDACNRFVDRRKHDFDDMRDEYNNSKVNDVPSFIFSRYDIINGVVHTGYKGYITYVTAHEEYSGGAHPNTFINVTNFDPSSGGEITLDDIFKAGYEEPLTAILTDVLMKKAKATTIEEQSEQVMKNLGEVLKAAGTSFEKAVKTTCFLANMSDFAAFNGVYGKYFTTKPARSCVAAKDLPKGVLVEVEVVAVK